MRNGTVYAPAAVVVVLTTVFVLSLVTVTSQLAMIPPLESVTRPRTVPRNSCASAAEPVTRTQQNRAQFTCISQPLFGGLLSPNMARSILFSSHDVNLKLELRSKPDPRPKLSEPRHFMLTIVHDWLPLSPSSNTFVFCSKLP